MKKLSISQILYLVVLLIVLFSGVVVADPLEEHEYDGDVDWV